MSVEDIILQWRFSSPEEEKDPRTFDILLYLGDDMDPLHLYKVSHWMYDINCELMQYMTVFDDTRCGRNQYNIREMELDSA